MEKGSERSVVLAPKDFQWKQARSFQWKQARSKNISLIDISIFRYVLQDHCIYLKCWKVVTFKFNLHMKTQSDRNNMS